MNRHSPGCPPRRLSRLVAIVVSLTLLASTAPAQGPSHAPRLQDAEDLYIRGRFAEALILVQEVLESPSLSVEEKRDGYHLIGLIYVAMDREEEARRAIRQLLEIVPGYEPDPNEDPSTFIQMVREAKRELAPPGEELVAGEQPPPVEPVREERGRKGRSWKRWLVAGGGALITGTLVSLVFSGEEEKTERPADLPDLPPLPPSR